MYILYSMYCTYSYSYVLYCVLHVKEVVIRLATKVYILSLQSFLMNATSLFSCDSSAAANQRSPPGGQPTLRHQQSGSARGHPAATTFIQVGPSHSVHWCRPYLSSALCPVFFLLLSSLFWFCKTNVVIALKKKKMSSIQAWLMIALAVSVFAPKSFFFQTNVVIFLVFNKCCHCFGLITNVAIALVLKQISSLLWF